MALFCPFFYVTATFDRWITKPFMFTFTGALNDTLSFFEATRPGLAEIDSTPDTQSITVVSTKQTTKISNSNVISNNYLGFAYNQCKASSVPGLESKALQRGKLPHQILSLWLWSYLIVKMWMSWLNGEIICREIIGKKLALQKHFRSSIAQEKSVRPWTFLFYLDRNPDHRLDNLST